MKYILGISLFFLSFSTFAEVSLHTSSSSSSSSSSSYPSLGVCSPIRAQTVINAFDSIYKDPMVQFNLPVDLVQTIISYLHGSEKLIAAKTNKVFISYPDGHPKFPQLGNKVVEDPTGLIWGNVLPKKMSHRGAKDYCLKLNPPADRAAIQKSLKEGERPKNGCFLANVDDFHSLYEDLGASITIDESLDFANDPHLPVKYIVPFENRDIAGNVIVPNLATHWSSSPTGAKFHCTYG